MGIPAYFSYIIKNYIHVLNPLIKMRATKFHNLYMDCNSVIYDAVREIYKTDPKNSASYPHILALICSKIQGYIDQIRPSSTVYIAFDGVAPLEKMEQQRSRRYLNNFLEKNGCVEKSSGIDTCLITPGTRFMKYLSKYVYDYPFKTLNNVKVIVSCSDQWGEGEHKLFQHIRDFKDEHLGQNTVIYGLDADLLMLSIFHKKMTTFYVFRETPEYAKSLNMDLKGSDGHLLDINELCVSIFKEMKMPVDEAAGITLDTRIHDYAFLCFLLGNDFMPHRPVIDIRIDGIQVLMNAYRDTMQHGKLIDNDSAEIIWEQYNKVLGWIDEREAEIMARHTQIREKQDRRLKPWEHRMGSEEEKYKKEMGEKRLEKGCESWILKYYKGVVEMEKVSERQQKNYIMPMEYVEESIKRKYSEYYEWNGEMSMGYRKYLWEGKPKMKKMPYEVFVEMGEFLKTLPEPEIDY
jgi:5'-3' exonuclease